MLFFVDICIYGKDLIMLYDFKSWVIGDRLLFYYIVVLFVCDFIVFSFVEIIVYWNESVCFLILGMVKYL